MLVFINYWIEKCTVKHWKTEGHLHIRATRTASLAFQIPSWKETSMGLLEDVWYTTGEMLLLAHHVGFSSPLPYTWPVAILYIGQDQISIGKEPSATLLLNMGIICASKWIVLLPPCASHFLQEVRVRNTVQVYVKFSRPFNRTSSKLHTLQLK